MKRGGFVTNYRRPPEGRDGENEREGDDEEREGDDEGRDGEIDGREGETDGREGETDGREGWDGETDGRDVVVLGFEVAGRDCVVRGVVSTCGAGEATGRLAVVSIRVAGVVERMAGRPSLAFVRTAGRVSPVFVRAARGLGCDGLCEPGRCREAAFVRACGVVLRWAYEAARTSGLLRFCGADSWGILASASDGDAGRYARVPFAEGFDPDALTEGRAGR